jgi:sulfite exporter TauE/SafE
MPAIPEVGPVTLLIAGLLGSTHCVAMCGGIATALGTAHERHTRHLRLLAYQMGRIASYGMAGALAGGAGAASLAWITPRWSESLRLATAGIVILIGLHIAFGPARRPRWLEWPQRLGGRVWRALTPYAQVRVRSDSMRPLLLGMIWGWLPCGLVYSALLAAAVAGSATRGALDMLAFGAGTMPALLGISIAGLRLSRPPAPLARLLGTVIVGCGLWTAAAPTAALLRGQPHTHHLTVDRGTMKM